MVAGQYNFYLQKRKTFSWKTLQNLPNFYMYYPKLTFYKLYFPIKSLYWKIFNWCLYSTYNISPECVSASQIGLVLVLHWT